LVVIKLSSLCKNVVGGEFSTKLKGYWGQNGGWAIAVELPQTIYVIKIEMAQGYYLFCKKIILKIFKNHYLLIVHHSLLLSNIISIIRLMIYFFHLLDR